MGAARRADRLTLVADDRGGGVVDRRMSMRDATMVGRGRAVNVALRTIAAASAIFVMLGILVSPG
jgi:hypothetical protein